MIYGVFEAEQPGISRSIPALMQSSLPKCGLESRAFLLEGKILLGHQTLATTNESIQEIQPIRDPASGVTLVCHAWLDNRKELLERMDRGPDRCQSDAQLILWAYLRWEEACFSLFEGDFSLAIWDPRKNSLICARDPLGVRPFYYHSNRQRLVFASDIRAVLAHPEVDAGYDRQFLASYLSHHLYERRHATFFQAIRKLPPANFLRYRNRTGELFCYWRPPDKELRLACDQDYAEALKELLKQAVSARLRTPFPVGAHLSGGLDSSAVAVLAGHKSGLPVYSWSPPPPGPMLPVDERHRIVALCQREGFKPQFCARYTYQNRRYLMRDPARQPTAMLHFEEAIQQSAARDGVRVLLSGWGGDEFVSFNGRGCLAEDLCKGQWRRVIGECLQTSRRIDVSFSRVFLGQVVKPLLPWSLLHWLRPDQEQSYMHPDLRTYLGPPKVGREWLGGRRNMGFLLNMGHLNQRMEDWTSSGAEYGIVYRYPLLDRRLVEFCFQIPVRLFYQYGFTRYLFRLALQGLISDQIIWGFPKREYSVFRELRGWDPDPGELHRQVRKHAASPFVDGPRLLGDWGKLTGTLAARAVECLFLEPE